MNDCREFYSTNVNEAISKVKVRKTQIDDNEHDFPVRLISRFLCDLFLWFFGLYFRFNFHLLFKFFYNF